MALFDGVSITVGGQSYTLRYGLKALMQLDYELGERHGLKESILAPVTLDMGDGTRMTTTRLQEWLSDMSAGYLLRWAQFIYAGLKHTRIFATFDDFLDIVTEDELSIAMTRMAEAMREQLSSSARADDHAEAAASGPLSGESNTGSTCGPSAESILD